MFSIDLRLLEVALLTIIIEVPIFYICGYRSFKLLGCFALVNFVSNLLLNEGLPIYTPTASYWLILIVAELLVIALEFVLMLYLIREEQKKLFKTLILTNLVSAVLGLILFI